MSVNIPSMNVPFTDKQGRINPIWHEFLRSFVTQSVDGTISAGSATTSVTSGNGLTGGGIGDVTLAVGQGAGIAVNADDVSVNIEGQTRSNADLDDEIIFSDVSDNNAIRKTKFRDVPFISSPGGDNNSVQYNSNGIFGGDTSFTSDGTGYVLMRYLTVSGLNTGATNRPHIRLVDTNGGYGNKIYWTNTVGTGTENPTTYFISSSGGLPFIQGQSADYQFSTLNDGFSIEAGTNRLFTVNDSEGVTCTGTLNFQRNVTTGITASTTQTQGQGPLTSDINRVTTVANANDTVTLKTAVAGRSQLIINDGANILRIFPASGDNLGAGVNTSTTLAAGGQALYLAYDSTNYKLIT